MKSLVSRRATNGFSYSFRDRDGARPRTFVINKRNSTVARFKWNGTYAGIVKRYFPLLLFRPDAGGLSNLIYNTNRQTNLTDRQNVTRFTDEFKIRENFLTSLNDRN